MAYAPQPRDPTNVMGRRILAFIIDAVLVFALYTILFALFAKRITGAPSDACPQLRDATSYNTCVQLGNRAFLLTSGATGGIWLVALLFGFANNVVLQGATGASIGKYVTGLRVIDAQGNVCGFGRAFVRWLLLIVDWVLCFLIGLITAFVTHPHRRIGDMAGGTYVVGAGDVGTPIAIGVPAYAGAYPPPGTAWGAQDAQTPVWGAPVGAAPPAAAPPAWGTPPPPPPVAPAGAEPNPWGAPPPAPVPPPAWGAPPPPVPPPDAAPPTWGTPPPPAAPTPPAPPPPPPVEPPPPAPPDTPPPPVGESWWDKAVDDDPDPSG